MCIKKCLDKIFSRTSSSSTGSNNSSNQGHRTNSRIDDSIRMIQTMSKTESDYDPEPDPDANYFVKERESVRPSPNTINTNPIQSKQYSKIHDWVPKTDIDPFQTKKFTLFQETIIMVSNILNNEERMVLSSELASSNMLEFQKNRYLPLEYLGRGGSAEVTKARDMKKATYVAIKKFYSKFFLHGIEEAWTMCQIKKLPEDESIYLTKIKKIHYDSEHEQKVLILIIDIGVCSLRDIIRMRREEKQYHSENEIILIAENILKGLLALEKLQIVHGDVKPANILYCRNPPRYVLTDFGESYTVNQQVKYTNVAVKGFTPYYAAPNESGDEPNPFKNDIWALGMSLLELIEPSQGTFANQLGGEQPQEFKTELHENGFTSKFIESNFKGGYSSYFWNILGMMLKIKSTERSDAETLLKVIADLKEKKRHSIKNKIMERKKYGTWSKAFSKDFHGFAIDEEGCAKKIEEQKVVNMSSEFDKIIFLDDFIQEYDRLYDFNYCMRLTEKKLEILEKNLTLNCAGQGVDESLAFTLLKLAHYCRLSEYHSLKTLAKLKAHQSDLDCYFKAHEYHEFDFLLNLGAIHRNLGNFKEAKTIFQKGMEKTGAVKSENLLNISSSEENLEITRYLDLIGTVYLDTADYETALNYFKKSLEIKQSVTIFPNKLSINASNFVVEIEKTYNNIGLTYLKSCKLTDALTTLSQNIKIVGKQLRNEHINPDKAITFSLIGKIKEEEGLYSHAYDNYNKSKYILERLTATREHPQITRVYLDIGNLFEKIGIYNRAIEKYEEALEISRKCFDQSENLFIADCNSYLGSVYCKMAMYKKADWYYEEALNQYRRVYEPNKEKENLHQKIANIYIKKAILCLELEKKRDAKNFFKKALNILIALFGEGAHPDESIVKNYLGVLCAKKGNFLKAIKLHMDAVDIIIKVYKFVDNKNYHPEIARTLTHIGLIYIECRNYVEAEKNFLKSKETYDVFFKDPHPEKAKTIFHHGNLYLKKGDEASLEKAKELINKSLVMLTSLYRVKPDHHPDIIACLMELGAIEEKQMNFPKAIEYTQKSIKLARQVYKSEENLETVKAKNQLSNIYIKTQLPEEAELVLEEAIEIGKRLLPESHPVYISLLGTKLQISTSKKRFEEAYNLSEQIRKLESTRSQYTTISWIKGMTETYVEPEEKV